MSSINHRQKKLSTKSPLREGVVSPRDMSGEKRVDSSVMLNHTKVEFRGPLPPPEVLSGYNNIEPGLVNRIVTMAEENGAHIRKMQQLELNYSYINERLGQVFAFIIMLTLVVSGTWLIYTGHTLTGFFSSFAGVASILAVFIWGHWNDPKDDNK